MRFNDTLKKYGKQLSEYQASHSRMPSFLASSGLNKALIEEMFAPENVDLNDPAWKTGDYRHVQFISVLKKYIHNKQPSGLKISYSEYQSHQEWKKDVPLFEINITGANTELQNKLKLKKNGSVTTLSIYTQDIILVKDLIEKKQKAREQEVKKVKNKFREKNGVEPIPRTAEEIASDTFASLKQGGVSVFKGTKETAGFIGTKVADGFKNTYNLSDANSTYTSAKQELAKAEKLENRAYYFQEITQQIIEKQNEASTRRQPVLMPERAIEIVRRTQRTNLVRRLSDIIGPFATAFTNEKMENSIAKLKEIAAKLDSGLFQSGHNPQLEIKEIVKMKKSLDDLVAGLERPANFQNFLANFPPADGDINAGQAAQYARYHLDYLLLTYTDKYKNFLNDNRDKGGKPQSHTMQNTLNWAQAFYKQTQDDTKTKKDSFDTAENTLKSLKDQQGHYAAKGVTGAVSYTLKGGGSVASVVFSPSKSAYKQADTLKNKREAVKKFNQAERALEEARKAIDDHLSQIDQAAQEQIKKLVGNIAALDNHGIDKVSEVLGSIRAKSVLPDSRSSSDDINDISTGLINIIKDHFSLLVPISNYVKAQKQYNQAEVEKGYYEQFSSGTREFGDNARDSGITADEQIGVLPASFSRTYNTEASSAAALPPHLEARKESDLLLRILSKKIQERGATWDSINVRPLQRFIYFAHGQGYDAATISEFLVTRMDKDSGDSIRDDEKSEDGTTVTENPIYMLQKQVQNSKKNSFFNSALEITDNGDFLQSLHGNEVVKVFLTAYIAQEIKAYVQELEHDRALAVFEDGLNNGSDNLLASQSISMSDIYQQRSVRSSEEGGHSSDDGNSAKKPDPEEFKGVSPMVRLEGKAVSTPEVLPSLAGKIKDEIETYGLKREGAVTNSDLKDSTITTIYFSKTDDSAFTFDTKRAEDTVKKEYKSDASINRAIAICRPESEGDKKFCVVIKSPKKGVVLGLDTDDIGIISRFMNKNGLEKSPDKGHSR